MNKKKIALRILLGFILGLILSNPLFSGFEEFRTYQLTHTVQSHTSLGEHIDFKGNKLQLFGYGIGNGYADAEFAIVPKDATNRQLTNDTIKKQHIVAKFTCYVWCFVTDIAILYDNVPTVVYGNENDLSWIGKVGP